MNSFLSSVLVLVRRNDNDDLVIEQGLALSEALNQNIAIIAIIPDQSSQEASDAIVDYLQDLKDQLRLKTRSSITTIVKQGRIMPVLSSLSDELEAASIVMEMPQESKLKFYKDVQLMKQSRQFKMPFLMVRPNTKAPNYNTIYIPISFRKEEKEKFIWASYFGRFNNSDIVLIPAHEKDVTARNIIKNHLLFAQNLLTKLNLSYKIIPGCYNSLSIAREATELAAANKNGIVLICSTKHYGPDQEIVGPPELKAIKNREQVPVLCINPRKDLYVLCE
ncbi:hypothetical protein [Carboxylicivirga sp. N1Y90]|uniref:hypothetical protein n=1 Tax=Carboxylicivirga fragile TaxID=3417571 RepID=UPI003D33925B|nr:hypothetical protein [Marinilabiliaceae bacterium N1Y90]